MIEIAGGIVLAVIILLVIRIIGNKIASDIHWHNEKKSREKEREDERKKDIAEQERRLREKWEL